MAFVKQPISFLSRIAQGFAGGVLIVVGFFSVLFIVESGVFSSDGRLVHADAPPVSTDGFSFSFSGSGAHSGSSSHCGGNDRNSSSNCSCSQRW